LSESAFSSSHDGLVALADAIDPVAIHLVCEATLEQVLADDWLRSLASFQGFKAQAGAVLLVPGCSGRLEQVLLGFGKTPQPMTMRALPGKLPAGDYRLAETPPGVDSAPLALAWALGGYVFDRYKPDLRAKAHERPRLAIGDELDLVALRRTAHAAALARDMINTPANQMGPRQIESIAREIAEAHGASFSVVEGEALIEAGYPAVHAVGRAASPERAPRMIELNWTGPGATADSPLVAVIGKGVVFDTGGLDIKPSAGMRTMKKDMGGAAHALALGRMLMGSDPPIRLVVLLPVVENAISGDAMRPGDVLATRAGITVEVGNTDAEGRLILADALTRAAELEPHLTIDLATLTGAARVALGPELPPFFTDDEELAAELAYAALTEADPMWRLPLWPGYEDALSSDTAELANDPAPWAQAGAVTAALFLKRFAPKAGAWAHVDIFAWNARGRPGWPVGGEAMAIRAIHKVILDRFGEAG
jgi:leucyl aminopeptidase